MGKLEVNIKTRLGFSTGALYQSGLDEKGKLEAIKKAGCRLVELGFIRLAEFFKGGLENLTAEDFHDLDYVSLHAPKHNYGYNSVTRRVFEQIEKLSKARALNLVIFHPDDVENFEVFKDARFKVAFENMDNHKKSYREVAELEGLFAQFPDFNMVLDVNHAYSNDSSMKLAAEFSEKLGSKITQIHLSGYSGYHEPLFQTKQVEIIRSIQGLTVPIIIESVVEPADLKKEMLYIVNQIVISGLN